VSSDLKIVALSAFLVMPFANGNEPRPVIDRSVAAKYFAEARALSDADSARLWGKAVYGPMLFVDPATRDLVANQADAEGKLIKDGDVYTGRWSADRAIANTATTWAGVKWTIVMWPLPADKVRRARLMAHELFHRIQDDLGLPAGNPANAHLDARDGRVWMQLEWRALAAALRSEGEPQRQAIADALAFRDYRRSLVPGAAAEENSLEMNEGLCEYTGVRLSGASDSEQREHSARRCESEARTNPSLTRSFAYASGPPYGLLLDRFNPNWRVGLTPASDLGALLRAAAGVAAPTVLKATAQQRAANYDGSKLMADEDERESRQQKRLAEHRQRFVDGPVLTLPLGSEINFSFDPTNVETFDATSSVYPTLTVTDVWGVLEVSKGALMIRENGAPRVVVPAPPQAEATPSHASDGWRLELKPGWTLVPGPRKGDVLAAKQDGTP